jgi:hypothetical protein
METKFIFESFKEWYTYLWKACKHFAKGIFRIVYSLIMGIASILVWVAKLIGAFCKRETTASIILFSLIFILSIGWLSTYMNGKVATKTALYQRDSISLKLDKYLQAYESSEDIIVGGDTIRYGK